MARKDGRCGHNHAFPTIYYGRIGYLWCPDCGATRSIKLNPGTNAFYCTDRFWTPARGHKEALRVMSLNENWEATEDGGWKRKTKEPT